PGNKEKMIHALDIQLWNAPDGRLFVFWIQEDVVPRNEENLARTDFPCIENFTGFARIDGFMFVDFLHATWCITCDNPDDDEPVFSEPRFLFPGFMRNKPLALTDKRWLMPGYDQVTWNYGYSITDDGGMTFRHIYGGKKVSTRFDETMAYKRADGSVRMLARTSVGVLGESISTDDGETFPDGVPTDILNPNTRFFISRTPTGRLLMIGSESRTERTNMTLYLSDDDGKTWFARQTIDTRPELSYPDADFYDGKIYFTYDRERCGAMEIYIGITTEDDIINGVAPEINVISKP
ncbi:MAG: glycoside hydrolase, partial [Clostridia bacterium]|nr:glycoside hydrolase [Clostridia bacterium]